MAYKQSPGRMNMPKTGQGVPSALTMPNPDPVEGARMRTDAEILKQYPGAVKVDGKINEFKYKGATLNPARYPVENKGKTVKQAIEIKNKK
jgi:hypothetical protein